MLDTLAPCALKPQARVSGVPQLQLQQQEQHSHDLRVLVAAVDLLVTPGAEGGAAPREC